MLEPEPCAWRLLLEAEARECGPVEADGTNRAEDLNSACRNAVLNMMDLLQQRGFSREQAYVLCSVAVDLTISNVVDVPNYVVSALLPEDIFDSK